jgi:cobalamin biosynthetic protein CobC
MAAYEVADDLLLPGAVERDAEERGREEHGGEEHGGDLGSARRMFPDAPEPFVDLSTGINPNPYPVPSLSADLFARLPESAALAKLAAVAAATYGAPSAAHVVPAPGTQLLLPAVAGLVEPGRAAVLTPTYAEHARTAALAGHSVIEVRDIAALGDAQLAILTNPNNPDGRLWAKGELLAMAKTLRARGGVLVVDEAFMDVELADASLADAVSLGNIVVLRSFGKFFGLAGLRLGFALAAPPLVQRIASRLGPWAVSGPALAIGAQALADRAWIDGTRSRLAAAANRLDAILTAAGLDIVGGTTLFRLAHGRKANALFVHLGRAGIFVRRFHDHPAWLRFGLPAAEQDWQLLQKAMAAFGDNS